MIISSIMAQVRNTYIFLPLKYLLYKTVQAQNHIGAPPLIPPLVKYMIGNVTYIATTPIIISAMSVLLYFERHNMSRH